MTDDGVNNEKRELFKKILIVIFGNLVYALGVVFFIMPSGLITGGTTGIALVMNHTMGIPVSLVIGVFNVVLFLIGFAVLGKTFALTTVVSTFAYPAWVALLQKIAGDFVLTDDLLICALFGGICIGISLGMILRIGASTGGMDIPPLILNKFFRIPVSVSLYVFDFAILILQMFFSSRICSLYGIVLVMVYTVVMDRLMAIGQSRMQLEIVSQYHEKIRKEILEDVDRGVTLLHGRTGFLGRETEVVKCIVSPREVNKMEKLIHKIDPDAFIILNRVNEVSGRGFTRAKRYLKNPEQPDPDK